MLPNAFWGALTAFALAGSIVTQAAGQETSTYEYDNLGRLKKATRTRTSTVSSSEYAYDRSDNRTTANKSKTEFSCAIFIGNRSVTLYGSPDATGSGSVWVGISNCTSPVTLNYSTQNGSLMAGVHYQAVSGQTVINPGSGSYYSNAIPLGWLKLAQGEEYGEFLLNVQVASGNATINTNQIAIGLARD